MAVSISDIFVFVGDTVRPLSEGEAVYSAGHVSLCGYKKDSININKEIVGYVLQTSNLRAEPHRIIIILNDLVSKWQASCSCKAGAGGMCKHIIAVLLYANRHETLDELSCTDLEQVWGQSGASTSSSDLYGVDLPLLEYCHPLNKRTRLNTLAEEELEALNKLNFEILQKNDSNSALSKTCAGRHALNISSPGTSLLSPNPDRLMEFQILAVLFSITKPSLSNNLIVTTSEFYNKNIVRNLKECEALYNSTFGQRSSTWRLARKHRITGSNCYSCYTYQKGKHMDWTKKIFNHLNPSFEGNLATAYGLAEEQHARLCYERRSGLTVFECGFIVNPAAPWLGFSADGINILNELIEIKCPVLGKTMSASDMLPLLPYLQLKNGEYCLKQKHTYFGQIQLGLTILNLELCNFILYSSFDDSIVTIRVLHDKVFCSDFISILQNVYVNEIIPRLV